MTAKIFKDGDRLLVRLEKYDKQTLKNLENLLQTSCDQITGLVPPEKPKEVKKRIETPVPVPNANENIQNKFILNMPMFNQRYQRYSQSRNEKDRIFLMNYVEALKRINPETLPENEVRYFLSEAYKGYYQTRLISFMKIYGIASLNALLQSGTFTIKAAYSYCVV